jgi:hypothetical protein
MGGAASLEPTLSTRTPRNSSSVSTCRQIGIESFSSALLVLILCKLRKSSLAQQFLSVLYPESILYVPA